MFPLPHQATEGCYASTVKPFQVALVKPVVYLKTELDYYSPYEVKVLNLYVYKVQGKELMWQGTASGSISADAASTKLAEAVSQILANFPPKK